nr:hypothetical protein [Deltaproteobacteria bacterium]
DPTSAIALLRELPADSAQWPVARHITRAAVAGGVERRLAAFPKSIAGLAFSPDGKRLASASGAITIHDLAAGTARVVASTAALRLIWRDNSTVVFAQSSATRLGRFGTVDVFTDSVHHYPHDAYDIAVLDGRVIAREQAGVAAYGPDRARVSLFEGATRAIGVGGGRVVVLTTDKLVVIGEPNREISLPSPVASSSLHLSADGSHVAALTSGFIHQWHLESGTERVWPRLRRGLGETGYVGNTLYAWSSDGSGFVSLDEPIPVPQWTTPERDAGVFSTHILPFRGGAMLVTDAGAIAHATELGVLPLVHRSLDLVRAAVDPAGTRLALGTANGEVLLLDTSHVAPTTLRVAPATSLAGAFGTQVLVLSGKQDSMLPPEPAMLGDLEVPGLAAVDLTSRAITPFTGRAAYAFTYGAMVVAHTGIEERAIFDTTGKERFRITGSWFNFHDNAVFYLDRAGVVWRHPLDGAATQLATMPANVDIKPRGDRPEVVTRMQVVEGVPFITIRRRGAMQTPTRFLEITPAGIQQQTGPPGESAIVGRTRDGLLWGVVDGVLWRAPFGIPITVPLSHEVAFAYLFDDRIWAFGTAQLTVLDGHGGETTSAIHWTNGPWKVRDGVVLGEAGKVIELVPGANVRRTLGMHGEIKRVVATPDGARMIALSELPDDRLVLGYWNDPVPADSQAVRAYLDTLTNARLQPSSDVLRWDN